MWIKSSVLSAVSKKKQKSISLVVSSPQVTRFGGDDGFDGLSAELSNVRSVSHCFSTRPPPTAQTDDSDRPDRVTQLNSFHDWHSDDRRFNLTSDSTNLTVVRFHCNLSLSARTTPIALQIEIRLPREISN